MLPDRKSWAEKFVTTEFLNNLDLYFDRIIAVRRSRPTRVLFSSQYDVNFELGDDGNGFDVTPREYNLFVARKIHLDTFYYVDYIRKNTVGEIYDIGCGSNAFKYFFEDVIGIDSNNPNADFQREFNSDFVQENQKKLPGAFAINSLHYIPVMEFKNRLRNFASCIKPGGFGYITFNIERILAWTPVSDVPADLHTYIESEILDSGLNILQYDLFDVNLNGNNGLDGNIRVLFKA
jgi:hypothetical protein